MCALHTPHSTLFAAHIHIYNNNNNNRRKCHTLNITSRIARVSICRRQFKIFNFSQTSKDKKKKKKLKIYANNKNGTQNGFTKIPQ